MTQDAAKLGDVHAGVAAALAAGTLRDVLWCLRVVLEDQGAPVAHVMAITKAIDSVEHDVLRGTHPAGRRR